MDIFGVGGFEVALIVIIALVVAGPARMAVWARSMGQWVTKMRKLWSVTATQLQRELDDAGVDFKVPKEIPTRKAIVDELSRSSTVRDFSKPINEVRSALAETEGAVREVQTGMTDVAGALTGGKRPPFRPPQLKPNPPKPDAVKPDMPSVPSPKEATQFGTWGGAAALDQPEVKSSDLGTWSADPKEQA